MKKIIGLPLVAAALIYFAPSATNAQTLKADSVDSYAKKIGLTGEKNIGFSISNPTTNADTSIQAFYLLSMIDNMSAWLFDKGGYNNCVIDTINHPLVKQKCNSADVYYMVLTPANYKDSLDKILNGPSVGVNPRVQQQKIDYNNIARKVYSKDGVYDPSGKYLGDLKTGSKELIYLKNGQANIRPDIK
jgi:hypothetical protein